MVGESGFEPSKSIDDRFTVCSLWPLGNSPIFKNFGAGGRTRTPDLLITNQLLYQLSYTSKKIFKKVGRDGFEPSKSSTSDLQSDPFGHLGTCPYKNDKNKSWWTDSNPRPADYKSAALPTELHQQNNVLYIII